MDARLPPQADVVLCATNDRAALPLEYLSGTVPDLDTYLANNDGFSSLFREHQRPTRRFRADGARLPAGAQLLGRRGDDQLLLDLAAVIEEAGIGTQPLDLAR